MLFTSILLTVFVLLTIGIMLLVTKVIGGKSARFFTRQQKSIGNLNGYIEEMINGQKVVKVFCHEKTIKNEFDRFNDELNDNAFQANKFANILMPVMGNLANLQYVLVAVVGGAMALAGVESMTIGGIVSFLQLSRGFTMPITQMSQQLNSIVMAMAGAERIFALMDERPEADDGYVTLVNVRRDAGQFHRVF